MRATAASRPPKTEKAILSAELTVTGGGPDGVTVGPTGVFVGAVVTVGDDGGGDDGDVMTVVPDSPVLGGGV